MNKYSLTLVIKGMQITLTIIYHLTSVTKTYQKVQNMHGTKSENTKPSFTVMELLFVSVFMKNIMEN